jgi:nucleotide-binding universal stress UspA family protein
MSIKGVLVHVEASDADAARLECARAVARMFDAALIGLGAETFPPVATYDPYGSFAAEWYAILSRQIADNLQAAERRFGQELEGLRAEWRAIQGAPLEAMCESARGADLLVVGGRSVADHTPERVVDPARLALRSGRPVLIAPPMARPFRAENILVAWKDVRESRRALADSMPFLVRAQTVTIAEICSAGDVDAAHSRLAEVRTHLLRHGITAKIRVEAAEEQVTSARIEEFAEASGADLIVAGCYGHSRLQEWVFGGVTRHLLSAPDRFLLMSH